MMMMFLLRPFFYKFVSAFPLFFLDFYFFPAPPSSRYLSHNIARFHVSFEAMELLKSPSVLSIRSLLSLAIFLPFFFCLVISIAGSFFAYIQKAGSSGGSPRQKGSIALLVRSCPASHPRCCLLLVFLVSQVDK